MYQLLSRELALARLVLVAVDGTGTSVSRIWEELNLTFKECQSSSRSVDQAALCFAGFVPIKCGGTHCMS